jgi:hypothetical protein
VKDSDVQRSLFIAMILGTALFGGIHIGAWNFDFPSRIELIFWRRASVYSAAYGPSLLVMIFAIVLFFNAIKLPFENT